MQAAGSDPSTTRPCPPLQSMPFHLFLLQSCRSSCHFSRRPSARLGSVFCGEQRAGLLRCGDVPSSEKKTLSNEELRCGEKAWLVMQKSSAAAAAAPTSLGGRGDDFYSGGQRFRRKPQQPCRLCAIERTITPELSCIVTLAADAAAL